MTNKSIIKVKEWFGNKVDDEAGIYGWYPVATYVDHIRDNTQIRIEEVVRETEKAIKVVVDCEDRMGNPRALSLWIPKSVIIK